MSLANQIHVNTRYTRSINVERDRGSPAIVDAYLPTARSIDILEDLSATLGPKDRPRAWSLVGPYGSGKSSFALFLHELLGPPGSAQTAAGRALAAERPDLARRFARQDPWCRVVLTGSEEPLGPRLLAALDDAATNFWFRKRGRKPNVVEEIRRARKRRKLTDSDLLGFIDSLQAAVERNGAGGLLLVIDELGKFLEYEARQGGGGIFLLQQLAERAFQGRNANLLFFVLLHQGFDLYARGMGERLKNDWAKVQGRFESVSFVETSEQTLRIVAAAFSNSLTKSQCEAVRNHSARMAKALSRAKALPSGLEVDSAAKIFASCYPIHPISLLALPLLCQRFAAKRTDAVQLPWKSGASTAFRIHSPRLPSSATGYFLARSTTTLFTTSQPCWPNPLTHRRWAEVVTAVERVEDADRSCEARNAEEAPFADARQDHRRVEPDLPKRGPESVRRTSFDNSSPQNGLFTKRSDPS